MARVIDHVERISDSFDTLDSMSQADIVCELFTRLAEIPKLEAIRRITNHAKMSGVLSPRNKENGEVTAPSLMDRVKGVSPIAVAKAQIPPLMERAEVESAGKLALEPAKGGTQ